MSTTVYQETLGGYSAGGNPVALDISTVGNPVNPFAPTGSTVTNYSTLYLGGNIAMDTSWFDGSGLTKIASNQHKFDQSFLKDNASDTLSIYTSNYPGLGSQSTTFTVTGASIQAVGSNASNPEFQMTLTGTDALSHGTDTVVIDFKMNNAALGLAGGITLNDASSSYTYTSSVGGDHWDDRDGSSSSSTYGFANGDTIVCYAKGTLIHTERGYISVEKLKVGDGVRTVSGSYEPIVWLGHRSVDIKRHTNPAEANPVRICKDAFGIDQPSSDLFLSPLHSVYVDGIFIPAIDLVNGTTVIQEKRSQITYYHIELPTHNAIYAQGLTAESYLDDSNRNFFIDDTTGQVVDMTAQFAEKTTTQQEAKASTQWFATVLRNGPEVEAVKARLEANAVKRVKRVA